MVLNKQKGNMYGFVTHTWNPIKGKCSHDCKYCYMKVYKQKPLRLVEKELEDDLGEGNFIFVGSSTDMFAEDVDLSWIMSVLSVCRSFPKNKYLFQSKNPARIYELRSAIPPGSIIATTIESNREFPEITKQAPPVEDRCYFIGHLKNSFLIMVTIEPILDFDINPLLLGIRICKPTWVNIGADSKGHKLPEPSPEKVKALIEELKKVTEVKIKPNLNRLLNSQKKPKRC